MIGYAKNIRNAGPGLLEWYEHLYFDLIEEIVLMWFE
jgi:hypothetical protein